MHFTRPRDLLVAGVVGFGLGYLLFEVGYDSIPQLPALAGVTLLVLAAIEAPLGFVIRGRIRRREVITGIWIARAVALAKASSVLGALMLGLWLAALLFLAPRSGELVAAADDLPATIVGLCSALALTAAALWLEYCCRAPESRDHEGERK